MRRTFRLGFGRGHVERDVDDELAFHIDMRTERLVAGGMSPEAARAEALRQFGALTPVRESCVALDRDRERITRRMMMIDDFRQDVAYAVRTLRRNPGFATVVALTIALGVGANTAIFTLVDAVMLRALDVPAPERLVAIGNPARTSSFSEGTPRGDLVSYPLYQDLVRTSGGVTTALLASGRAIGRMNVVIAAGKEAEHPRTRFVSGNYFEVLGLHAGAGRALTPADDRPGAAPVVVISDDYWARRFDRSPDVVGSTIRVNDVVATVVGVGPKGWTGEIVGDPREMWIPLAMQPLVSPNRKLLADREKSWLLLLGRLRPGVDVAQARRRLGPLLQQLIADGMSEISAVNRVGIDRIRQDPVYVESGARGFSYLRSTFATPLVTLMAGVGLLLLIVCANVANLLLARSVARGREMSVRLAIGAGRGRLVRQLLTESLVLALLGAAGGLLLASWGARLLLTFANQTTRTLRVDALDLRILAFTVAVSLLAVALFGLAPALGASRIDLASSLRAGGRALSAAHRGGRRSPASLLIAAQVALSLLLLVGTGLLVRSLQQLQNTDPGLARDQLLIVEVDPTSRGYAGDRLQTLARELAARFARIPGVAAVSWSANGVFSGTESKNTLQAEGFRATQYEDTVVYTDQVGPDYVRAVGGRLLAGRDISAHDDASAPPVALVNETMARFYFPNGDAVGKRLTFDTVDATVVGVVADIKDHELRGEPVRRAYLAYAQPSLDVPAQVIFEVRAERDPAALVKAVSREIAAQDAALPIFGVDPLSQLMKDSIRQERLLARLSLAFGALALVLASVGLFGVMSYAVTRRTGELGVRVALGAQRSQVLRMVLWDALKIVLGGMAVGLPAALFAARLLRTQLYGVGVADPVALGVAVTALLVSGAAAALAPALRASRVAPNVALRAE